MRGETAETRPDLAGSLISSDEIELAQGTCHSPTRLLNNIDLLGHPA